MKNATLAALVATTVFSGAALADDYVLTLKDHSFSPNPITIPADQKVTLTVKNDQDAPAEFESSDFDREKVVNAHSSIDVSVGPLKAGTYGYFDDFHEETTGQIIAK